MWFDGNVASCLASISIDSTRHRTMTLWPVWFNFGTYLLSFYMRAHWFLSGKHLGSRVCWRMLRPRFCCVWVCFTETRSIHACRDMHNVAEGASRGSAVVLGCCGSLLSSLDFSYPAIGAFLLCARIPFYFRRAILAFYSFSIAGPFLIRWSNSPLVKGLR